LRREFAEQLEVAGFTGAVRIYIGDTGAFLFLTTSVLRMRNSLEADVQIASFLSETMGIFCLAGSAQQAQQSTHLADPLNKPIKLKKT